MSRDRSPAELESDFAAAARVALGAGSPATALTTLLHIGEEHVVVLIGRGDKPETVRRLDLGAARIARAYFHHDPPTPREIERAIDFAEDEIMLLDRPTDAAKLLSTAPALRSWGAVSGAGRHALGRNAAPAAKTCGRAGVDVRCRETALNP